MSILKTRNNQIEIQKGFTLLELLITMSIVAVLATVITVVLNPANILAEARDAERLADVSVFVKAFNSFQTFGGSLPSAGTTAYASLPDSSDICGTYTDKPGLASAWSWHCSASADYQKADGFGWIPLNLSLFASSGVDHLPVDPVNDASHFYIYVPPDNILVPLESNKYKVKAVADRGTDPVRYEVGSDTTQWANASALIGYWGFDEGSGITAYDSSPKSNNGALQPSPNTPTWTTDGRVGQALSFDGTNDFVAITNNPTYFNINVGEAKTLVAWFKGGSTGTDATLHWKEGNCLGWSTFMLSTGQMRLRMSTGTGCSSRIFYNADSPSGNYGDNNWHLFTGVIDRPNTKEILYLDGASVASTNIDNTGGGAGGSTRIGTNYNDSLPFKGTIDEVRIYNRALSATEVKALYDATK